MFQDRYFSSATVDASGNFAFSGLPAGPVAFYARAFYTLEGVFYDNFWLTTYEETDPITLLPIEYLGTADLSDRNEAIEPLTFGRSLRSLGLHLLDEKRQRLVSFRSLKALRRGDGAAGSPTADASG